MLEEAAISICWVAIKTDMIEMPVSLPVSCCCLSIFHFKSSGSPLGYGGRGSICDSDSGPHASSLQDTLQQINRLVAQQEDSLSIPVSYSMAVSLSFSCFLAFSLSFWLHHPFLFPPPSTHCYCECRSTLITMVTNCTKPTTIR